MDPKIVTALLTALAAIVGAIIGGLAKGYVSRQKRRELELEYEKRLQAGYLENARTYLSSVYVPLAILVTKLNTAYQAYRSDLTVISTQAQFRSAIIEFRSDLQDLGERGANAFLTTDLDETLQSFNEFLFGSQTAEQVSVRAIVKVSLRSIPLVGRLGAEHEYILSGKKAGTFRSASVSMGIAGIGFTYQADEILKAPLNSVDFEKRFVRDIHMINVLIKEVTLGSAARENK
jgi:hypothetical protein